ncbi:hypothetical protein [Lactococcus allomyrinae]|uniref:Anticodon nuclease n=1 Tax=Lactococcus allomyrinae TaxID=2419773 RepID=A0A387BC48_9LACT|nr:hypothetical protein [Lactococcus allomyrinae]AYG00028.1 hypothetical protein D7I46_02340 [Lactococcus allomyrinae]
MSAEIKFRLISDFIKEYNKENNEYARETKKRNKMNNKNSKINNIVQIWYAFNGTGKTRFTVDFEEYLENKKLRKINKVKKQANRESIDTIEKEHHLLYYNAYTEDLFYWNNENQEYIIRQETNFLNIIASGENPSATKDIEPDFENELIDLYKEYTQSKIQPKFDFRTSKVIFTIPTERGERKQIKISRGEERIFVWTLFFVIMKKTLENLEQPDEERDENYQKYSDLEYILIDDPISSLDDNNSIIMAISLAELIKKYCKNVKFIVMTHHTLFYSILAFELKNKKPKKRLLMKQGEYYSLKNIDEKPFSNHIFNLQEIGEDLRCGNISQKHFAMLRSTLEKTATFLNYNDFPDLLKKSDNESAKMAIRTLHSLTHGGRADIDSNYIVKDDIEILKKLYNELRDYYHFNINEL